MKRLILSNFWPKSVFFRLIVACSTLVALVSVLTGVLVNRLIVRGYHHQIEDAQQGAIDQYAQLLERDIVSKADDVFSVLLNPSETSPDGIRLVDILLSDSPSSATLVSVYEKLRSQQALNPFILSICIYDRNKDFILSSLYGLKYLDALREPARYYVRWVEDAAYLQQGQMVLSLTEYEHSSEWIRSFTLVQTYPLVAEFGQCQGAVAIEVDESYVRQMLRSLITEQEEMMLVDGQGRLLAGTMDFEAGLTLAGMGFPQEQVLSMSGSGVLDDTRNSGSYYACSTALDNGWRLVKIISGAELYSITRRMQRLLITVSLLTLLLGLTGAVFFSRRIYNPLRSLTELLRTMGPIRDDGDEYQLISQSIQKLNARISTLRLRMDEHIPLLKNNLVADIINNNISDGETFTRRMALIDIPFSPKDRYQVLVLQISRAMTRELEHKNLQLIKLHLTGQMEQLCNNRVDVIAAESSERQIAAMLIGDPKSFPKLLNDMVVFFKQHYDRMVYVSEGRICRDPMELYDSYQEALRTVRQMFFHTRQTVLRDRGEKPLPDGLTVLRERLLCGEHDESRTAIGEICAILQREWFSYEEAMDFLQELAQAYAGRYVHSGTRMSVLARQVAETLPGMDGIGQYQVAFIAQMEAVAQVGRQREQNRSSMLIDKILRHIDEHLGDDLSVNVLSDLIGLSSNYLSKIFKVETGEGLAAYIIERRMEKARELLLETSYHIEKVASMVGYPTHHHFSKIFKQQYGCTPTQYRDFHRNSYASEAYTN